MMLVLVPLTTTLVMMEVAIVMVAIFGAVSGNLH